MPRHCRGMGRRQTFSPVRLVSQMEFRATRMESPPAPCHWPVTALLAGSMRVMGKPMVVAQTGERVQRVRTKNEERRAESGLHRKCGRSVALRSGAARGKGAPCGRAGCWHD
jgi:hypothetical protein